MKLIFYKRKLIFVSFLSIIVVVVGLCFILIDNQINKEIDSSKAVDIKYRPGKAENQNCVTKIEEKIVRGNSLAGLIEDGQVVRALFGYYDCRDIQREDVVLYSFVGSEVPLIKIIKGVPGDEFNLQQIDGGWYILINDAILKNSENIPYLISGGGYEMLALYVQDYQGIIPDGAYLLLGNIPWGAVDSTRFGLVSKSGILGKVEH